MAGNWKSLSSPPSVTSGSFNAGTMLLLTDGTVLVNNSGGSNNNGGGSEWLKLTPDPANGYSGGSWGSESDMANTRLFCASGILRDGRLFVVGGEFSTAGGDTPLAEIYDPNSNSWSTLTKPTTFNFIQGDCSACVLPDGRVIFGALNATSTAIWDPVTENWVQSGTGFGTVADTKTGWCNEEGWTLLADGTVMAVNVKVPTTSGGTTLNNAPNTAERYFPAEDIWRPTGTLPNVLALTNVLDKAVSPAVNVGVFEIGPAMLLADKTLISFGATGHTAVWTAGSDPKKPGTWAAGPDFPADPATTVYPTKILTLSDAPAVLQPNGRVLVIAGTLYRNAGPPVDFFSQNSQIFEYDPVAKGLTKLGTQPPSGATSQDTWTGRFLLLPTGEILFSTEQSQVYIYTPDPSEGSFQAAWQPVITIFPTTLIIGHSYLLTGTGLNGISQANNYGDDAQMATNYPIVQLTDTGNGKIYYLKTQDFSTLGVATSGPQTCSVTVVQGTPPGSYNLVAIANGIPSANLAVEVGTQDIGVVLQEDQLSGGQVQAQINLAGAPAVFQTVLYVAVEGYKLPDMGISGPVSLNSPGNKPSVSTTLSNTITFAYNGSAEVEDITYAGPQRVLFPFQVSFSDASVFSNPAIFPGTNQKATMPLLATWNPPGGAPQLAAASTMTLEKTPNPFLLHNDPSSTDPTVQQAWYLSIDLRVFQVEAGQKRFGATVARSGNAVNDATGFITQAIKNLNGDPAVADGLFAAIPENEDAASLSLAPTDGTNPVYSFALARVRTQDVAPANDVRVFFRMWAAQQTNAVYDPNTTYAFRTNGAGEKIPVLGVQNDQIVTVPFFALPRINAGSASMATQTDEPNVQAVIAPDPLGAEVHTFYGCWLDINQPGALQFPELVLGDAAGPFTSDGPLLAVQSFAKSAHQCLIAEISYDPDPITIGADPSSTGKLAQRNLAFVNVPNPGSTFSRIVPQTFEIRPSPAVLLSDGKPDELMIQWVNVPHGSTASIYLPDVSSAQVLDWASRLYLTHRLTATDTHTIQMPIGGVSWVPVPQGSAVNYAGLLSIELPAGIKKGQEFKAVVRQITSAGGFRGRGNVNLNAVKATSVGYVQPWRTVLGQFSLTIPVSTRVEILPGEEKLLSIMKWIWKDIHPNNRWYPVFKRYLEQLGGRVTFMGGDPGKVIPTGTGNWQNPTGGGGKGEGGGHGDHGHDHHEHHHEFIGKVHGLIYDHFGDFEGFVLEGYDGVKHRFFSREMRVEERVRIACDERAVTKVIAGRERSVVAIVIGIYE